MMARLQAELEVALKAMTSSFHVRLIATFGPDLVWAPVDVLAAPWLAESNLEFDQFPVKQGEATVGVLVRGGDLGSKTVGEAMQPMHEGLIVSAETPIADLIPQLRETPYRLVRGRGCIDGLVTRSDLLKLPVRLVVFALITHLEQVMADVIKRHWSDDSWLKELSEGRQSAINKKEEDLRRLDINPPTIELTEFCDKQSLCKKLIEDSRSRFDEDLKGILILRDQIAHASSFVDQSDGKTGVAAFVAKFENMKSRIDELTTLAASGKAPK